MLAERVSAMLAEGQTLERIYLTLLTEGVTVAQIAEAVEAGTRTSSAEKLRSRVVRVVTGIGTALVGVGVFSFVASNWSAMTDGLRLGLILGGMVLFSGGGLYVRDRYALRVTGEGLLLLGSVIFGAGIFLVAQMYNIRGNWPDGMVWWTIGTLAAAGAARSMPLSWLGTVLAIIAAFGYPFGFFGEGASLNPYIQSSPFMILAGAAVTLAAGAVLHHALPRRFRDRW